MVSDEFDYSCFRRTVKLRWDFEAVLDVLINLEVFPGSGPHPQGNIFAKVLEPDYWSGFEDLMGKYIVFSGFGG